MLSALRVVLIAARAQRSPHASPERLRDRRNRRLRRVLRRACDRVPYLRMRFQTCGANAKDFVRAEDLENAPLCSLTDLRLAVPAELRDRTVRPESLIPPAEALPEEFAFDVLRTPTEDRVLRLFLRQGERRAGVRLRDRLARLRAAPVASVGRRPASMFLRWLGFRSGRFVDTRRPLSEVFGDLATLRPDVIIGDPAPLVEAIHQRSSAFRGRLRARLLVAPAGELESGEKAALADSLGCRVAELYTSPLAGLIAWQCRERDVLHVADDAVVAEVVRDGRPVAPGERGEVVVTSLHLFSMPVIRFRTGDEAVRGDATCPCGSPFSTLREIRPGRVGDARA